MIDDGTGFGIGQRVWADDPMSEFEAEYLGLTKNGLARVRDIETGEVLVGSIDYIAAG